MLGLVSFEHPQPDDAYEADEPENVAKLITAENHTVWGDFYVCPVAAEKAGWMRFVVLKKARKLFVART
jgi:hypothetical protein